MTTYINKVELQGFVGGDAQPKEVAEGKTVLNFSLATSKFRGEGNDRKEYTSWHKISAWGKVAQSAPQISKGAHLHIVGELRSREYTTDRTKVQTYEIVASKIEVFERANEEADS